MMSYLDAGTGSMIVTAVAGGLAGIGVAVKMGMARLKAKVTGKPAPDGPPSAESPRDAHD